ncbi:carboxymuconolactone decarboxylase family protein [Pimelobacter simplex]|uniref:carboxymuconolactone decarboxylase family protein n=1 Tax=Nocardioides simplex TaxID=2045 RepID=UPI00193165B7|nr:carboxymuconolactone decarboxylase family protein [Pimelobacter simplex]
MTSVGLLAADQADEADAPALAAGQAAYGQMLNNWAALLNSPGLLGTYLPFLRQVNGPGELDVRVKDLAAVRVAVLNHCLYTTSHRCTSAMSNGATEAEVIAVAKGEVDAFEARKRVAVELASDMTLGPTTLTREASVTGVREIVLEEAKALFTDREFIELTVCISMWNALATLHRSLDLPLDMPAPPADVLALI